MSILDNCIYCGEEVNPLKDQLAGGGHFDVNGVQHLSHRECAFRMITGGIGHWLDHEKYCVALGDPDAGLTYRESAILVDALYAVHGRMPDDVED